MQTDPERDRPFPNSVVFTDVDEQRLLLDEAISSPAVDNVFSLPGTWQAYLTKMLPLPSEND